MAVAYQDAYNQLGTIYDPQTALVNQQVAAIPGEFDAQRASLQQAKVNAFRDISNQANSRGLLFSGFSPAEEAQYTGTKYLPALAAIGTAQKQRQFSLQDQLNKILGARATQAQGIVSESQKRDIEAQKAAQDAAYKAEQLKLGYARLGVSQSNANNAAIKAAQDAADKIRKQYSVTGKAGDGDFSAGYNFIGPNKRPISLAQYVASTGGGANDVLDLLKNGSKYDQNIYRQALSNVPIYLNESGKANYILNRVKQLDTGHFYGL